VAFPDTVAVPTVFPPEVQVVGSLPGPKTVKVMVPVGLDPEAKVAEIALAAMAAPTVPVAGPLAVKVGLPEALTVMVNGLVAELLPNALVAVTVMPG
jgi:hypothetical protein